MEVRFTLGMVVGRYVLLAVRIVLGMVVGR